MKLFNIFNKNNLKSFKKSKAYDKGFIKTTINNSDLALDVFNSLIMSRDTRFPKETQKIIDNCNSRQEILDKVIFLLNDDPETPKKRYILAMAYSYSYRKYNKQAIYYLENYLKNEPYDEIYRDGSHYYFFIERPFKLSEAEKTELEKNIHLGLMYMTLGDKYEIDRSFDMAISNYKNALQFCPFYEFIWVKFSKIYLKMKQPKDALNILLEAKGSKYYSPTVQYNEIGEKCIWSNFKTVIDQNIKQIYENHPTI